MKKITVVGRFSNKKMNLNGQTIKTISLTEELEKISDCKVMRVDTVSWSKNIFSLIASSLKTFFKSDYIIIMPASRGIKLLSTMYTLMNFFFKRKLIYVVIGGWLPDLIKVTNASKRFNRFDYIFVETNRMMDDLNSMGLDNVHILKNFKRYKDNQFVSINEPITDAYKLVVLSRINYQKGVTDAIKVVKDMCGDYPNKKIFLDIYGQIEDSYYEEFSKLLHENIDFVTYKGTVQPFNASSVLAKYDLLLFPTRYFTEGIPGTIIDAYSAGIPVLASRWSSASEIIDDGRSGLIFEFLDINGFKEKLEYLLSSPEIINNMKEYCLEKFNQYTPDSALLPLFEAIGINRKEVTNGNQ